MGRRVNEGELNRSFRRCNRVTLDSGIDRNAALVPITIRLTGTVTRKRWT
jgi:hypothetical protein